MTTKDKNPIYQTGKKCESCKKVRARLVFQGRFLCIKCRCKNEN